MVQVKRKNNILGIYSIASFTYLVLAHLLVIFKPTILLAEPISSELIFWVHLHTIGVISQGIIGAGLQRVLSVHEQRLPRWQIFSQFSLMNISLLLFLAAFYLDKAGWYLNIVAGFLFLSLLFYVYINGVALWRQPKERRGFVFWIEALSLFFLLQAIAFGVLLASNLSFHFFKRNILHSLKLHAHSGVVGFWFLQYFILIYEGFMRNKSFKKNVAAWRLKLIRYPGIVMGLGLFLWTSVHDRFSPMEYIFGFLALSSLLLLFVYLIGNKKFMEEEFKLHLMSLGSLFMACFVAGIMLVFPYEDFVYTHHLPWVYIFLIFYGCFIFFPLVVIFSEIRDEDKKGKVLVARLLSWLLRLRTLYFFFAVIFCSAAAFEKIQVMRLLMSLMLILLIGMAAGVKKLKVDMAVKVK